jgi:hypothetical protein
VRLAFDIDDLFGLLEMQYRDRRQSFEDALRQARGRRSA